MKITIADIMTKKLTTLSPDASLHDAHSITKKLGIRHIPVVNEDNEVIAIITQKTLIANVMKILSNYGERAIERKEKHINVMDVADKSFDTVGPERNVRDVAEFFLMNKHGCLPVIDQQNKLIGIVTSSDFIRLSISLLKDLK